MGKWGSKGYMYDVGSSKTGGFAASFTKDKFHRENPWMTHGME